MQRTSLLSIIKNDYGAGLGLLLPAVFWCIAVVYPLLGFLPGRRGQPIDAEGTGPLFMAAFAAVTTIITVPLSLWRVFHTKKILQHGVAAVATIRSIEFDKDRGRVEYEYELNGKIQRTGNAIWKNVRTVSLMAGDQVEVAVDPNRPASAYIIALYE